MQRRIKPILLPLALLVTLATGVLIWADSGAQHQISYSPLVFGTTGGNINDITAFCCSGTLGAPISIGGQTHILSNNHVLARVNEASAGEQIIHPGLIDQDPVCAQDTNDVVGTLADFVPISFKRGTVNEVDAAIATPSVAISNEILDIGGVSEDSVTASIGQDVQKSGRTTGHTVGTVNVIGATIDVAYNKECGKGRQVARFVNQVGIGPGAFSAGGDSGSLIVENVAGSPRRVGLLFAGSSTRTWANPYAAVASAFPTSGGGNNGGGNDGGDKGGPPPGKGKPNLVSDESAGRALLVKQRHESRLFQAPGVVGVGIGANTQPGQAAIVVMLREDSAQARRAIPLVLDGVPVRVEVSGEIVAYGSMCSLR